MFKIKFEGIEEIRNELLIKKNLDAVKTVVKFNGSRLQAGGQRKAPVDTGFMKQHIDLEICDNGLTAKVTPTAEYAAYVEFGTRFMKAQPFMGPALRAQAPNFVNDLKKLVR